MAEDRIKLLEERLTRLEAAQAQRPGGAGGFTSPGGVVVDPAPNPWQQWGFHPRPFPSPVVDPAPSPWGGWVFHPRPFPHPIVDPGPFPTPVVDPAPMPGGGVVSQSALSAATLGRIGHVGDPPPFDISRLTAIQLEAALHSITAEKARLDSMEATIKKQIAALKQQEKGK
jgi:hypothetical protein